MTRFQTTRPHALLAVMGMLTLLSSAAAQCAGAPTFSGPVAYTPSPAPPVIGIDRADLDGDGDLDIVACGTSQIVVLRNQGAGVFNPEAPVPVPFPNVRAIVCADFDEDGLPDVAVAGAAVIVTTVTNIQGQAAVFLNRTAPGAATVAFLAPAVHLFGVFAPFGSVGVAIDAFDLDVDGIVDLLVTDQNSGNAWALFGQGVSGVGSGSFGAPAPILLGPTSHTDAAIADFDQDGAPDLAFVRYGGGVFATAVTLMAGVIGPGGTPTGTFVPAGSVTIPATTACLDIHAVDADANGVLDLVVASHSTIEVAYGAGGFVFVTTTYPAGIFPESLAIGDFSGDGITDIAAARNCPIGTGGGNFSVLVGQPAGFASYTNLAFNSGFPQCITSGDFDGDGLLDVAAGRGTGGIDVRLGSCPAIVPRAVTVISPNGGEVLASGSPAPIVWSQSASVALVDVDVSRNGGGVWERIASGVAGTSLSWAVTDPATTTALVRVSPADTPSIFDASDTSFTILGAGGAAATTIGAGCSPLGAPPVLTAGAPVLGAVMPVSLQGAAPARPGGLWVAPVPVAPVALTPGCTAYLDLGAAIAAAAFTTDAQGGWSSGLQVPGAPGLFGQVARIQAAISLPGFQAELSNAVELTLGF